MTDIVTPLRTALGRDRGGHTATTAAPTADRSRYLLPAAVVLALVVGVAGWLLLVAPQRSATAAVRAQTAAVTTQVDALQSRLATLRSQQGDLSTWQAALASAQAALPTTAAMPEFLRTLQDLGSATGTTVTTLTATAPDGTAVAPGSGVAGVGDVYRVPVTVTVTGSYDGLTAFVGRLQQEQPRAVLVDSADVSAGDGGAATLSLSLSAFVAPTAGS